MQKVTLITGATGGLGEALSLEFAKNGHNLVLTSTNIDKAKKLKEKIESQYKVEVYTVIANLNNEEEYEKIYNFVGENDLFVDVLINNAGFGNFGEFVKADLITEDEMINVNICAVVHLTQLFSKKMIEHNEGKIVNVASIAAFTAGPYLATYYASKSYVLNYSYALASEVKKYNVHVLTLCPGTTKTGFEKRAKLDNSKLFKTLRVAEPQDVARYAYKKIKKNKEIIINGFRNRFLIFILRFVPRSLARKVVQKIQEKR